MLRRWVRGEPPIVIIADTGMLMGDVWASCRGPKVTSLLWALHNDGALLVLPGHVLTEIMERLPRRAGAAGDVSLAYQRLTELYLPRAIIVDEVPEDWGAGDPRVETLALRDPSDLPTARLAVALAPCHLLAEDPDICTPGLAVSDWLPVTHAASNDAELTLAVFAGRLPAILAFEGVRALARALRHAPREIQVLSAVGVAAGGWWLKTSGRGRRAVERSIAPMTGLMEVVSPPLLQMAERQRLGRQHLGRSVVAPPAARSLGEAVAFVLAKEATHDQPLLAVEVARQIDGFGTLSERTARVRSLLSTNPAVFSQVTPGRFALGRRLPVPRVDLDAMEVRAFLQRSHPVRRLPPGS